MSRASRTGGAARPSLSGLPRASVVNLRAVSVAEGVRAALAVAAIVVVAELCHQPGLTEAALAAWLTCLCDPGGPMRNRVPFLLAFGAGGAAMTMGFGLLLGAVPVAVVIALASLGVFFCFYLRVFGRGPMQLGNLLAVVVALAMVNDFPDWRAAAITGAIFWAGSLWALVLTLLIWRLHLFTPARQAIATCWRELAGLAADLHALLEDPSAGAEDWERHARAHRRQVREALEAARGAVLLTLRQRGPASAHAAPSLIRLEAAEQIFGTMIALSDLLEEETDPAVRAGAGRMLRRLRPVLLLLADEMVSGVLDRPGRLERAAALVADCGIADPDNPVRRVAATVAERLRIAITLAVPEPPAPLTSGRRAAGWRRRLLRPLRANLDWQSEALRHALRGAVAAAVGFSLTQVTGSRFGFWMMIMLVLIMQPYFALTITRAAERIGGTVAGGLLGALIAVLCPTPLAKAAALLPMAVIALSLRGVNLGLFMVFVTPVVVVLVDLGHPAADQLQLTLLRVAYTVAGGALALLAHAVLWPSWEAGRLGGELQRAIAAHGRYACLGLDALLGTASTTETERARRAAGMASNNVEASLQRLLLEPARGNAARLEAALAIDAALRRIAGRVATLQLGRVTAEHRAAWSAWRDWIATATGLLARGETTLPPRPLPPDGGDALLRIARQIELAAGALARL